MTTLSTLPREQLRPGRRERRAQRRRARRQDVLSARLAELHAIDALLDHAGDVVRMGWIQGGWFAVQTGEGGRTVTAYDVRMAAGHPVTGACLVGAVVHAAGGPAAVRTQLVQRTLDLLSHALHERPDDPVRWCPAPRVRMMAVLQLTHWNDAPERTRGEVLGLLERGRRTAEAQRELCRAERAALV